MTYFKDLGLSAPILAALEAKGYTTPTPIQVQAIPALIEGRDICGIAQTGTGKTAAFALPSIMRLAANPVALRPRSCRMLVLSPTRELAAQIAQSFRTYSKGMRLSTECVFGGLPIRRQIVALHQGVDVLVATPGRLLDLIDQRAIGLKDVEIFVIDEADQMLDFGFIHALKQIDTLLPKQRQTLFFSATMPKAIADLGARFLNNPVKVSVAPQSTTAERVEQHVIFVNQKEKTALLTAVLKREPIDKALVFTRTKHGADKVVRQLHAADIPCAAIHGNKSQAQRTQALEAFRKGQIKILIATDIAARGIDVSGVSHVVNFELPNVPEQYVHRIGRTARAGAEGVAISFVDKEERAYLKQIERTTRVQLTPMPLPEDFAKLVAALPVPVPLVRPTNGGGDRRGSGGRPSGGGRPSSNGGRENARPQSVGRYQERVKPEGNSRPQQSGRPAGSGRPSGGNGSSGRPQARGRTA
jgi:ATP-dependent RNA helicase RhlE